MEKKGSFQPIHNPYSEYSSNKNSADKFIAGVLFFGALAVYIATQFFHASSNPQSK